MSQKESASQCGFLVFLLIAFTCACVCVALEIATNFVPSMLLRLPRQYASEGDKLTFWGRTYCNDDSICYTVDSVEPKVLIPVLTALCATGVELILLVVLCILKCCHYFTIASTRTTPQVAETASLSSDNDSGISFDDIKSPVKAGDSVGGVAHTKPCDSTAPFHPTLTFVLWLFVLLLLATQVVALALGICFYEKEHKKYSDCWKAYGPGFFCECASLGLSCIAFFVVLIFIILEKMKVVLFVSS